MLFIDLNKILSVDTFELFGVFIQININRTKILNNLEIPTQKGDIK